MNVNKKFIICSAFMAVILLIALFAKWIVPYNPNLQNLSQTLQTPNSQHIFGTDRYGRDLFSRVLIGANTSIFSVLFIALTTTTLGTILGIISGLSNKVLDLFIMRISDTFLAFPRLIFAITVAGIFGGGIKVAIIAICITAWSKYTRLSRNLVLSIKSETYIKAAILSGTKGLKLIIYHILPNILSPILVTTMLDIGTFILELSSLSFLGLGAMPPTAEWGAMMNNGRSMIQTAPWLIIAPGTAIFITVSVFNIFGDALRDFMDTKNNF